MIIPTANPPPMTSGVSNLTINEALSPNHAQVRLNEFPILGVELNPAWMEPLSYPMLHMILHATIKYCICYFCQRGISNTDGRTVRPSAHCMLTILDAISMTFFHALLHSCCSCVESQEFLFFGSTALIVCNVGLFPADQRVCARAP